MSEAHQGASRPLVSVVLPTRDRLELLRRAVASVRVQTEQRLELIVVDDVSSDATADFLVRLGAEDPRVRVVRNSLRAGGGGARNAGISLGRGEWTAFIDDDDEWLPEKLERQLRALAGHPSAVACSCGFVVRSGAGGARVILARTNVTVQQLLMHNWLGGASVCLCSSAVLRDIGGFDPKLRAAQDLDLWVRLRQRGEVVVCAEALALHRAHRGPRITTDARSQYLGARRFHLKYRRLMNPATRRHRIAHSCYVMSTEATRRLPHRLRLLAIAVRNAAPRFSVAYARRSLPLLVRDVFARRGARSAARMAGLPARTERK